MSVRPTPASRRRPGDALAVLVALAALVLVPRPAAAAPIASAHTIADDTVRVLFLGNSYTKAGDLPLLVEQLAASAGRTVEVDWNTPGGNTLGAPQVNGSAHAFNATSLEKIASGNWDAVVLQDQSYLPTITQALAAYSVPAVQSLAADVAAGSPDARVVLYMTWGREQGGGPFCLGNWCSPAFPTFGAMQAELAAAYAQLADAAGAEVCPVGLAWQRHLAVPQHADLYAADGSHPSLAGSYLAACAFYARLFDASPVGLTFTAGLPAGVALALQRDAATAVRLYDCGTSTTVDGVFDLALVDGGEIGAVAHFEVSGAFGSTAVAAFAVSAAPAAIPFGGSTLAVDPTAFVIGPLLAAVPASSAPAPFAVAVPLDPALVGLEVHVQGAVLEGGALELTDAVAWRPCP